jgi:hypothetical protein
VLGLAELQVHLATVAARQHTPDQKPRLRHQLQTGAPASMTHAISHHYVPQLAPATSWWAPPEVIIASTTAAVITPATPGPTRWAPGHLHPPAAGSCSKDKTTAQHSTAQHSTTGDAVSM